MDAPIGDLREIGERCAEATADEEEVWAWAERHAGHNWIYRGQRDARWKLESTLERTARRFRWQRPRAELEMGIFRRFQRHAHLFVSALPDEEEVIEWLSLIRHFGAPTRLIDWTYSFHIALFFAVRHADPAIEDEPIDDRSPAVWAIDSNWLEARALDHLERCGARDIAQAYRADLHCRSWSTFGAVYNRRPALPFVLKQNSWRLNERSVAQQGLFLCPGDLERGFEENLAAMIRPEDCGVYVKKLSVPRCLAVPLMQRAYRSGISLATLVPGLEGFVRSLGDLACLPEVLAPAELAARLGHHQPGAARRRR